MNPHQKRLIMFFGGCIPARIILTAFAKYISTDYLPYLGLVTLAIAIGFLYLYFTGKRKTGVETQGAPIWWMKLRIVHGLLYLLFSGLAFMHYSNAYIVLLFDTIFGLGSFLVHHYNAGDLSALQAC